MSQWPNLLTLTVKGRMMVLMSETVALRHEAIPEWTTGWKLKRSLDHAGITAQDMAGELGVHVGTVSRWMNDRETPRRAYLMAWALRCGVSLAWLTDETGRVTAVSTGQTDIPAGISAQPGYAEIDNDITRRRKSIRDRIPLTPAQMILARAQMIALAVAA